MHDLFGKTDQVWKSVQGVMEESPQVILNTLGVLGDGPRKGETEMLQER